jgi:TfdA family taurine catabolism dioxygenase TauD
MIRLQLPEAIVDPSLKRELDAVAATFASVEEAETTALTTDIVGPLRGDQRWIGFRDLVTSTIGQFGYIVVRGLEADEGRSLLIISSALGVPFDTYRPGRVVKRFRMSPWTHELSHTLRAGDFHTDGNVSAVPPAGTAMQCEIEDPGAPEYAEQRVAYLPDLLERLASGDTEDTEALAFLMEAEAAMAHERSPEVWRGRLVQNGTIRYHPESLRVASRRLDEPFSNLESMIAAIHRAAIEISVPFHTCPGDTVLVSNRTALHYRGACSVRFTRFPTEFESRSLFVLHLKEPAE